MACNELGTADINIANSGSQLDTCTRQNKIKPVTFKKIHVFFYFDCWILFFIFHLTCPVYRFPKYWNKSEHFPVLEFLKSFIAEMKGESETYPCVGNQQSGPCDIYISLMPFFGELSWNHCGT